MEPKNKNQLRTHDPTDQNKIKPRHHETQRVVTASERNKTHTQKKNRKMLIMEMQKRGQFRILLFFSVSAEPRLCVCVLLFRSKTENEEVSRSR